MGRQEVQQVAPAIFSLGLFMLARGENVDVPVFAIYCKLKGTEGELPSNRDMQRFLSSYIARFNRHYFDTYKIVIGEARRTYRITRVE